MKARKIIICIDGTGNEIGDNESNILKLYKSLAQTDEQIVHYVPGVGTLDGPRLFVPWIRRKTKAVAGLAFGLGLEDDVLDAYRFLCRTYKSARQKTREHRKNWKDLETDAGHLGLERPVEPTPRPEAENDHIYIFGFSRGAYAARILAGFIHNFGLLDPEQLTLVTAVFRAYRKITEADGDLPDKVVFKTMRQFGKALSPDEAVPIRCLGLFDTVASIVRLNKPISTLIKKRSPMELGTHANVVRNGSVRMVLQALAVDERRSMFRPLSWEADHAYYGNRFRNDASKRTQYVEQRWFPGYHSDIGGSPREGESGIGKLTLLWMLDELEQMERQANVEDDGLFPPKPRFRRPNPKHGLKLKGGHRKRFLEGGDDSRRTPDDQAYAQPDPLAPTHNSMSGPWTLLEYLPKTTLRRQWLPGRGGRWWYLPRSEPRVIPDGHFLDQSVRDRMQQMPAYRPENVPDHPV